MMVNAYELSILEAEAGDCQGQAQHGQLSDLDPVLK